jgi:hypothetical protein
VYPVTRRWSIGIISGHGHTAWIKAFTRVICGSGQRRNRYVIDGFSFNKCQVLWLCVERIDESAVEVRRNTGL